MKKYLLVVTLSLSGLAINPAMADETNRSCQFLDQACTPNTTCYKNRLQIACGGSNGFLPDTVIPTSFQIDAETRTTDRTRALAPAKNLPNTENLTLADLNQPTPKAIAFAAKNKFDLKLKNIHFEIKSSTPILKTSESQEVVTESKALGKYICAWTSDQQIITAKSDPRHSACFGEVACTNRETLNHFNSTAQCLTEHADRCFDASKCANAGDDKEIEKIMSLETTSKLAKDQLPPINNIPASISVPNNSRPAGQAVQTRTAPGRSGK